MKIKKSTPDSEIASKLTTEDILRRFMAAKEHSNRWDAERDRLRDFIKDHIVEGQYGSIILIKGEGTPRCYATTEGNRIIQEGCLIDVGIIPYPKGLKPGTEVNVVNAETGEILRVGRIVDNRDCYTRKPPVNLKLTEIPNNETTSQP